MSDTPNDPQRPEQKGQLRGLYGKVKVSVATLDKIIVIGIAAIALVLMFGMQHRGYTVTFDTLGGTPVESQLKMYGDLVDEPEPPTREGYEFDGWYTDKSYRYYWDMQTSQVGESMTLYAKWVENET